MIIKDIFKRKINRNIQGVIKVGQDDEANVAQELDEYVVTRELQRHFATFFDAYQRSLSTPTDDMGVWVSGFFGSGKSHFIKVLSYILENKEVNGKPAIDYFKDKIQDQIVLSNMQASADVPTDVVLFNIDSKASTDAKNKDNAILNVFLQVFNEMQGFASDLWIAEMERQLVAAGKYDAFKEAFRKLQKQHKSWTEWRDHYYFEKETIKDALVQVDFSEAENAAGFVDQFTTEYHMSIEQFADLVNDYITKTGKRVIFLADEVGQFIGESVQRMLNLQTVVEDLGAATHGKAWVVVTSQQAIDKVTDNLNGQDFSKIQGRFKTRISMSSADVSEVIRKRLLSKTDPAEQALKLEYDNNSATINNLIDFDDGVNRKKYTSSANYADNYPFIPYQFDLLQDVLTQIREHGSDGKHLSEGERSMLSLFQESAIKVENGSDNTLVPFSLFFEGLQQFLDHTHSIVIQRAWDNPAVNPNDEHNPFGLQVLKALFMVKYVDNFKATLNNLTTLMIDSIDVDRIKLQEKVKGALQQLINQKYVEHTHDGYEFLTDAEKDISDEINHQEVSDAELSDQVAQRIFDKKGIDNKYSYPKLNGRYTFTFNQSVDGSPYGSTRNSLFMKVITPANPDEYSRDELRLNQLSINENENAIVIDMPTEQNYIEDARRALKIKKFLLSAKPGQDARYQLIKSERQAEYDHLQQAIGDEILGALQNADVYMNGSKIPGKNDFFSKLDTAEKGIIDNSYRGLNYIEVAKSKTDIKKLFEANNELVDTEENSQALQVVLEYIQSQLTKSHQVSMKTIFERFQGLPYGYIDEDIEWLLARLFVTGKLKASYNGSVLSLNDGKNGRQLTEIFTKKSDRDSLAFQVRQAITEQQKRLLVNVADKVFDKHNFSSEKVQNRISELQHTIKNEIAVLSDYDRKDQFLPGHNLLSQELGLLKELMSDTDQDSFLSTLGRLEDDLYDVRDDIEDSGIIEFYRNEKQQEIWRQGHKDVQLFNDGKEIIENAELKDVAAKLDKSLRSNNPATQTKIIEQLSKQFTELFNQVFDENLTLQKNQIKDKGELGKEYIQDAKVDEAFKQHQLEDWQTKINNSILKAEGSSELDQLNLFSTKVDNLLRQLQRELIAEESREVVANNKDVIDTEGNEGSDESKSVTPSTSVKETSPIVPVKNVPASHLAIKRVWRLNSPADVDDRVAELKQALLDQIKDGDPINFTL